MAAVGNIRPPFFQLDQGHAEQLVLTISSVTTEPFKNILHYLLPFTAAWVLGGEELRERDPAQRASMNESAKHSILREMAALSQCADLTRVPRVYATSSSQSLLHSGGRLSCAKPIIFIPRCMLFRSDANAFTQETPQDQLHSDPLRFTDDETCFLIARQLAHIKKSSNLWKLFFKIVLIATLFFIYANPISYLNGLAIGATATLIFLIADRSFEKSADRASIRILERRWGDFSRAQNAAISTLNKIRRQNLEKRIYSPLTKIYLTSSGNNLLDLTPLLTTRIRHCAQTVQSTG